MEKRGMASFQLLAWNAGLKQKHGNPVQNWPRGNSIFSIFAQSTQLGSLTMGTDYKRTMVMTDDFDMKMNKEMMNIRGDIGGVGWTEIAQCLNVLKLGKWWINRRLAICLSISILTLQFRRGSFFISGRIIGGWFHKAALNSQLLGLWQLSWKRWTKIQRVYLRRFSTQES